MNHLHGTPIVNTYLGGVVAQFDLITTLGQYRDVLPTEGERKTFTSPSGRGRPAKRQRSRAGEGTRVDGTNPPEADKWHTEPLPPEAQF